MQASDLVELAALISAETPGLLGRGERISAAGIDAYWTASKCRLDRWSRRLKDAGDSDDHGSGKSVAHARSCTAICAEILTSEILTRVWTAAAATSDQIELTSDLEPIAQSILFGHQEARHRALNLIATGFDREASAAARLDKLRRVCERWTDLLLAPLTALCDIRHFAHDPTRVGDFAQDQLDEGNSPAAARAREILAASMQSTFRGGPFSLSPNADLNSRIAAAIVACLGSEYFEASGVRPGGLTYGWLFQARMLNAASDAQRLVEELLNSR
ncbi:MAG TPA: hypothetical protein VGY55_02540 [Pirellulales bacterium]|jgi:hypothetical protein|nr:hypothetical protein [Pirellulales bacterium]